MKLALVDPDGTMFSAAFRIHQEGHEIRYWITGPDKPPKPEDAQHVERTLTIGDGLVPKVTNWREILVFEPDVVVVYNCAKVYQIAETAGFPVWGSSPRSKELEADRVIAANIARRYGVGVVPETYRFRDPQTAMRKVRESGIERWVLKAEGTDVKTNSTKLSDNQDHLEELLAWTFDEQHPESIVLQQHVDGVEISTEAWFDYRIRGGWLTPINSTLERKRLMAGDVGPMTGAMGSVVWAWPGYRPRLFIETLMHLAPYLKAISYVGPIDVNCIVDHISQEPHFLEFTPRLGWDAFEAAMAGFQSSVGEFFVKLGRGEATVYPITPREFMVAVRVYTEDEVSPVQGPVGEPWLFLKDVKGEEDQLLAAGTETDDGMCCVFEVATTGETIKAAVDPIYEMLMPQLHVDAPVYRTDIGTHAQEDLDSLREWGYETPGSEFRPATGKTAMTGRRRA